MPTYNYSARDFSGHKITDILQAKDEAELNERLRRMGYIVTRVKVVKEGTAESSSNRPEKMGAKALLNFTIYLSSLLNAGVPLLPSLSSLSKGAEDQRVQRVINELHQRVKSGSSLKEAMSDNPAAFPKLYTAILGAGESSGELGKTLDSLAGYLEWQMDLRSKVKEAATYPIILFSVMILAITILMLRVVPTFEELFAEIGTGLPLPTQIILGVSAFMKQFWHILLLGIGGLILVYKLYRRTSLGHYNIDSWRLKLPLFGPIFKKVALSRFCHTMSLSLASGVNLLSALDSGAEVVGNERLSQSIIKAKKSVNVGEKLAFSLSINKEFPSIIITMIRVGEESGNLPQAFAKVNQFYDKEVPAAIKKFFALLEPSMIIFMGVVVGGIALSVILPLVKLVGSIGG